MANKPSVIERLRKAVAYYRHGWPAIERKQAPFYWPSWRSGSPQWSIVNAEAYVQEGFEQNAIIYSAIMYKARAACVAPLRAYGGNRDDKIALPDTAPLAALCRQPNEFMAWSEFQMLNTVFLNLIGNSFVYVDNKKRKDGAPTSLYALRPDRVAIVLGPRNTLKGYLYTPEGKSWQDAFPILPQDMIHVRLPNPGDPLEGLGWGLSPISPMAWSADVDNAATKFLKLFFEHGAMIPGVLSFDVPMTDDEVARARERWMEVYGGYENWSDTAVLDQGGKYQRVGLAFNEMGFENIDSRDESRMVAPFGVPAVLISTRYGMERSTFSNYEEARKAFWEDTMVPEMGLFETEYQSKLPVIAGSFVMFDFSNVPALRKDTPALMTSAINAWDRGMPWTVAAATVGIELADRFPGDDVGFLPFNSVPVTALLGTGQRPAVPARTTQAEEAEPTEAETGAESESEEAENKARKMNPNHDARGRFAEGGGGGGAARSFASRTEAQEWLAGNGSINPSLTEAENSALGTYKGDAFYDVNQELRDYGSATDEDLVDNIDSALSKTSLDSDVITYRGASEKAFGYDAQDDMTGSIISDAAFMSTSLDKGTASGFADPVLIEIAVPKGTQALNMENWKAAGAMQGESELLLPRNTKLSIISDVTQPNGKRNIKAVVVP